MERVTDFIDGLPQQARAVLFAIIVVAVLALGYLALRDGPTETDTPEQPGASQTTDTGTVVQQPNEPSDTEGAPESDGTLATSTDGLDLQLDMPVETAVLKSAASRAARIVEVHQSYRYDQNTTTKRRELNRLLAQDNLVDTTRIFPTGAAATRLVATRTVVSVTPTTVKATLLSATVLSFEVTADTTVKTNTSDDTTSSTSVYDVTMSYDASRDLWLVTEIIFDTPPA